MAYEYIKDSGDGEVYSVDGKRHFLISWGWATGRNTGAHNCYDTDVLVCEWTGEPCNPRDLPAVSDPRWVNHSGFNVAGEDEMDWDDYANKVKALLKVKPPLTAEEDAIRAPLSLQEIADRQESGVIIYEDSKEALVVNWSAYGPGELPRLFATGSVIPMAPEEPWHVTGKQRMEDARELLDGVGVIYDANDDLAGDEPIPGKVYGTDCGVMIVVPDGWN